MASYSYTAYGLQFESSFPLPELQPGTSARADISISYAKVPDSLPMLSAHGIAWQAAPGRMLLEVSEVARYLIVENQEIRIQPFPGTLESDVRIFLLGSVLGALLHGRRMLVLHASAIQTDRGAVLFMGRSGAGKSTLLGAFLQRGYAMLVDDKAGITLNEEGFPQALPGFPLIRLAGDAAEALGYPVDKSQLRHGLDKYAVPVTKFHATPVPLHAAYSLNAHNRTDIHVERLETVDQFQALNRNTYRRRFLQHEDQRRAHFRLLGAVSKHARVARVLRPDYPNLISQLRERIEEDMAR